MAISERMSERSEPLALYEQMSGLGSARRLPGLATPAVLQYRPRGPGGTSASDVVTKPPKPALTLAHGGPKVNVTRVSVRAGWPEGDVTPTADSSPKSPAILATYTQPVPVCLL